MFYNSSSKGSDQKMLDNCFFMFDMFLLFALQKNSQLQL